jgi:hypothetical protein
MMNDLQGKGFATMTLLSSSWSSPVVVFVGGRERGKGEGEGEAATSLQGTDDLT